MPYVEKLITKAKIGDLHNRRQVISALMTTTSAHKLIDDIAPKLGARNSGYFRIVKTTARRGDNVMQARVSFVDDLKELKPVPAAKAEAKAPAKVAAKPKPAAKPKAKPAAKTAKKPAEKSA